MTPGLTCKPSIYSELISVSGVRHTSSVILAHVKTQLSQHHPPTAALL